MQLDAISGMAITGAIALTAAFTIELLRSPANVVKHYTDRLKNPYQFGLTDLMTLSGAFLLCFAGALTWIPGLGER